jgi:hypothetical protein
LAPGAAEQKQSRAALRARRQTNWQAGFLLVPPASVPASDEQKCNKGRKINAIRWIVAAPHLKKS